MKILDEIKNLPTQIGGLQSMVNKKLGETFNY
jgi:hypothetical protein